jgi:hypothetical protein
MRKLLPSLSGPPRSLNPNLATPSACCRCTKILEPLQEISKWPRPLRPGRRPFEQNSAAMPGPGGQELQGAPADAPLEHRRLNAAQDLTHFE